MSTSRSNDLARPWGETNFDVTNDENNVRLARNILDNVDSWKDKYEYIQIKDDIHKLSKEQMVRLIEKDLNLPEYQKIFKLCPGRKLAKLLLGADVVQFGGKSSRRKSSRRKNIRRKSIRRKSIRRKSINKSARKNIALL